MELAVLKLHPEAILPQYEHEDDSGLDLVSIEEKELFPGQSCLIHTGISLALPPNTEAQIRPRSGLALNHQITVLNTPGTIDEGYRGEIAVILINHGEKPFKITPGMRIAQMVICPIIRVKIKAVEQLSNTQRGEGGFGSTGMERKDL